MSDRNATIIVTGSSGLIGSAVCEAFTKDGYAVAGLDRTGSGQAPASITNVPCDLTSEDSVADAMSEVRRKFGEAIASVIHLAAYCDFSGEPSPLYDQVTVQGTGRMLWWLKRMRIEQFVFSSTMLVHAPCPPGQYITEDSPVDPSWAYPRPKVQTEQLILAKHESVPAALLRIAAVYTDRCESLPLAHQIQRIYEQRLTSRVFLGDISTGQSFVHLDDVVDAFRATVARRAELPGEVVILIGERIRSATTTSSGCSPG
jgi:nucleoside-diphosphate-sugar epimerase